MILGSLNVKCSTCDKYVCGWCKDVDGGALLFHCLPGISDVVSGSDWDKICHGAYTIGQTGLLLDLSPGPHEDKPVTLLSHSSRGLWLLILAAFEHCVLCGLHRKYYVITMDPRNVNMQLVLIIANVRQQFVWGSSTFTLLSMKAMQHTVFKCSWNQHYYEEASVIMRCWLDVIKCLVLSLSSEPLSRLPAMQITTKNVGKRI